MPSDGPIVILLGSNIRPERNLPRGWSELARAFEIVGTSRVFETEPVTQKRPAPRFLNAAVLIRTDLEPSAIKFDVLRPIEDLLGRVRDPDDKSGPRIIDLDLVLYGSLVCASPLVLPDPSLLTCAYAAVPVAELVPGLLHPTADTNFESIVAGLDRSGVRLRTDVRLG